MPIRIVIADNHKIICDCLRALIDIQPDMMVIGEAANGGVAIKLIRDLLPDIVIMEITMPDLNGVETIYRITNEFENVKVIILSMYDDRFYVLQAFEAGAMSYVLKRSSLNELIHAIKTVNNNEIYIDSAIATIMFEVFFRSQPLNKYIKSFFLTAREKKVLQMIAEGKKTKEIAKCLSVSFKTIEIQRKNIMDKLGIKSIAQLTKYAIRHGLTTVNN